MRNLLALLLIVLCFDLAGQLTTKSNVSSFDTDTSVARAEFQYTITNKGAESQAFWWNIDRGDSPENWTYAICDKNQCYVDGLESCPCKIPNVLEPGESFDFRLFLMSNHTLGLADIIFNITDDCEGQSVNLSMPIKISSTIRLSEQEIVADVDDTVLSIYPNPSTDYFQIKNDNAVHQIVISNIIGKKVSEFSHYKGESHDISYLDEGIYLVRLIDEKFKILDVKRITVK